jgi:hypothetical protein
MKNPLLILTALVSLTIANAGEGKRYVVPPGTPVATSEEGLGNGDVTINSQLKIVHAVEVKGTPKGIMAFRENGQLYYVEYSKVSEKFGR